MHPIIASFGHFTIPSYSLMILLGAVAAWGLSCRKAVTIPHYDTFYSILMAVIGAGIFGKILYFIVDYKTIIDLFRTYPLEEALKYSLEGGLVLYGGILGMIAGLKSAALQNHLDFPILLDSLAPSIAIGIAFGRIGCLLGGCCYGMPYDGPFAIVYPEESLSAPSGIPLFPSPIAESIGAISICVILLLYEKRENRKYSLLFLFLILYAVLRFTLEFFRGDAERGFIGILSTSQFISLAVLLFLSIPGVRKSKLFSNPMRKQCL